MGSPSSPLGSVLRRSQPLDGLLRCAACRSISLCSRHRDRVPFRGFTTPLSPSASSAFGAPLSLASAHCPAKRDAMCASLNFEAFIQAEPRTTGWGLFSPVIAPLFGFKDSFRSTSDQRHHLLMPNTPDVHRQTNPTPRRQAIPPARLQRLADRKLGAAISCPAHLFKPKSLSVLLSTELTTFFSIPRPPRLRASTKSHRPHDRAGHCHDDSAAKATSPSRQKLNTPTEQPDSSPPSTSDVAADHAHKLIPANRTPSCPKTTGPSQRRDRVNRQPAEAIDESLSAVSIAYRSTEANQRAAQTAPLEPNFQPTPDHQLPKKPAITSRRPPNLAPHQPPN